LLAVFLATDERGIGYAEIMSSYGLTRHYLGLAILAFGMLSVSIACVATWLIALYSSFRIAGPLFRLTQNLKLLISDNFALPQSIRSNDMLQREYQDFVTSQTALRTHYTSLRQALDDCKRASSESDTGMLKRNVATFIEIERRVSL